MSDIIYDDEFKVSSYLYRNNVDPPEPDNYKNQTAEKWSMDANRVIIIPTNNLPDLEDQWIKFNNMIKKHRRESDWKSIELYGCTNQEHYEKLRSAMLREDLDDIEIGNEINGKDNPVTESYIDPADSYYNSDAISYTSADVEKARNWSKESDRIIILPTRTLTELEELWDAFNSMIKKHKRESDWMSLELFSITNLQHYEYLKNQFLREDIRQEDKDTYGSVIESITLSRTKRYFNEAFKESMPQTVKSLLEMIVPDNGVYDNTLATNVVSDVLDKYDSDIITPSDMIDGITCGDIPYMNPDEMIDMGVFGQAPEDNFYGVLADNSMINDTMSVREWFDIYRCADMGLYTEFGNYASDWLNKVRSLMYGLNHIKESGDEKAILARKQSILELGWDPEIEFSTKARILAREMAMYRMKSNYSGSKYRMIDLREFKSNLPISINEASNGNYKPIYVVAIEGKSYFSKAIKALTKDIYSHMAISLDPELHDMYSYGIAINDHSNRKGFRREDIVDLPVGGRIGVFAFFVSDKVYKKICDFIDRFKDNAEKTSYSYINLITYLFNIPYNTEWKLICSQFVDRCLQAADINLTGRDSSQVSPADLNKAMLNEKRIYNLYEGLASKYNAKAIDKLVSALSKKAKPLKESYASYYTDQNRYITGVVGNITNVDALLEMSNHIDIVKNPIIKDILEKTIFDPINIRPIGEAKEFPLQFDKEGNLLIKNLKKLDYEAEYAKSHKLLKSYLNAKNYDGIKYELSKLWMMICMIEEKLHSKKFQELPSLAIESSSAHKARAKVMNDFKYYMDKLLEAEPSFNFTEYYDASPFSSATTKINRSTLSFALSFLGDMVKKFMKPV